MKWSFLLFSSFLCLQAIAQYPATGNKMRLGWQTTGDGLVYRGAIGDTATLDPSGINNAWMLLDTANGNLYAYRAKAWRLVSGGGGSVSDTLTGEVKGPLDSTYIDTVANIIFTTTTDTTAGVGELKYNDTQGSLIQGLKGGNVTNVIGQQIHQRVTNATGGPLTKGTAVFLHGSQGTRITVRKALATVDSTSANTFGIVAESIADNQSGYVITEGLITNMNTNALTEGAAVYLSPTVAGELTTTKPQAPQHTVYIGVCVKQNAGSGELFVKIRNGQELDELHDVRIDSLASNASLYYNAAQGVWRDTGAAVLVADTSAMLSPYLKESELSFSSTTGVSSFSTVVVNSFNALPWDGARVVGITTITGSTGEITLDLNGNQVILDISANLSLSGTTDTIELQSSTGTSVHFLAGQNVNLTHSNDTMTISVPISVSTNLSFSGASDTIGLQSGTGQKVFFREGDNINITQAQDTMALDVPLALSISTSLAAGPSTVIVDGSNKLPWDGTYVVGITAAATAGVTITLNDQSVSFNPLQFIDTSAMLSSYVNFVDTAAMLSPYLKKADTLSLSNRINAKLNISDTTAMLSPYLKKADTTSLSNRINTKLNISDTSVFARDFQISGTANYIPKFTAGNQVGNSIAFETGGEIGIGTITPSGKVHISNTANSDPALRILSNSTTSGATHDAVNIDISPGSTSQNVAGVRVATVTAAEGSNTGYIARVNARNTSYGIYAEASKIWGSNLAGSATGVYGSGTTDSPSGFSYGGYFKNDTTQGTGFGVFVQTTTPKGSGTVTPLAIQHNSTELMRVQSDGNVGIGTASPARILHVNATSAIRIPVGNFAQRGTSGAGDIRVRNDTANLEFHNGTAWQTVINNSDTSVFARDVQISGTANYLPKFTGSNAVGNSGVFESGGSVGIGTASPGSYLLNLRDSIGFSGNGMYFSSTNGGTANPGGHIIGTKRGSWGTRIDFVARDAAGSLTETVMSIDGEGGGGGNVGINTTTPSRRLHVEGETRISDLTTDPATRIVGADADGDLDAITIGNGVTFSSDTLKADTSVLATKTYVTDNAISTVYIPINLYAPGDTVANTTNSKAFFLVHSGLNGYCIDSYTVKAFSGSGTADIQIDKNGTGANTQAISGTTTATKDTNIALATGDYIRGQVFNLSGTLVGLGLTLEIKKTCN